jgi:hypothetical protein
MKHIHPLVFIAFAVFYATGTATAFTPGVPPHSGPGSVFHGNEEAAPIREPAPKQKSIPKQKLKKSRSEVQQSQPK